MARQAEMVRVEPNRERCDGEGPIAVLHHRAQLELRLSPPSLAGRGDVVVRALESTSVVHLDSVGIRISAANNRGEPLKFEQNGGSTCVGLPQPLAANEELTLTLAWDAQPETQGTTFSFDQAWTGSSSPLWLPTKRGPEQHATLDLILTVPDDLKIAGSHSQTVSTTRLGDGWARAHYQVTTPTSPGLYAFAAGDFRIVRYHSPGFDRFALIALGPRNADLEGALELTRPMFQILSERTGSKPATAYAQVFVRGEAAQTALGMSLIPESALRDLHAEPAEDGLIAHALAHQWFGVLVPCEGLADLWLNEGFATFMVAVLKEQQSGKAAYDRERERWRARSREVHTCGGDTPVALSRRGIPRTTGMTEADLRARGVIYYRGALVLDKLRRELGEEVFWRGVRRYVAEQAGKPTRTEDLERVMTASSGRVLKAFFDRWVYATAPDL